MRWDGKRIRTLGSRLLQQKGIGLRATSFVAAAAHAALLGTTVAASAQQYHNGAPVYATGRVVDPSNRPATPAQPTGSTSSWTFQSCVDLQNRMGFGRDAGTICNNQSLRRQGVKPYGR
jgi:hypothetical protein